MMLSRTLTARLSPMVAAILLVGGRLLNRSFMSARAHSPIWRDPVDPSMRHRPRERLGFDLFTHSRR